MRTKYESKYTEQELDDAVSLLDKSWIQVEVSNGIPNEGIVAMPGKKYIAINKYPQFNTLSSSNCTYTSYASSLGYDYPLYKNYATFGINSVVNGTAKANSKGTVDLLLTANHIYYVTSFIDGVNSNGITHGVQIELKSSPYTPYLSYSKNSLDAVQISMWGTVGSNNVVFAFYANMTNQAKASDVYFGRNSIIDLTETFGAGNEPSKEWCDTHIYMYGPTGGYRSSIVLDDPDEDHLNQFDNVVNTLDNNGKCLINLPGFDTWTVCTQYIANSNVNVNSFYEHIDVNKVKRYYIELPYIEKYTNGTNIIVPIYGYISAKNFVVYLYYEVDNHLVKINDELSSTVKYYIFKKAVGDGEGWNYYKDYISNSNKCVASGNMAYNDVIATYYASYSALSAGNEYICFSIVNGYDTVVS